MKRARATGWRARAAAERGQILLALLAILGVGMSALLYTMVTPAPVALERDRAVSAGLAQVKQALIGWSAARGPTDGPNARPGELPCPDMNNDGFEAGSCVAGAIGRVPWKTLGIPEPKDDAGETLWYTYAGPFRIWNMTNTAINSDTTGNLTVYRDGKANVLTKEAVAIVFAPGPALGAQDRNPSASGPCPTTGTTIARNLCAANYLDSTADVNNATTNGPFITARSSASFNDRLLVITTADLMPVVEQRVARELRTVLMNYKAAVGYYPYADLSDGRSDAPPFEASGTARNRGRVPAVAASPTDWPSVPAPAQLPGWFGQNNWRYVVYYTAGRDFLGPHGCSTCVNPTLSVDGVSGKEVVILMPGPGPAPAGKERPAPVPLNDSTYWTHYFHESENGDGSNDAYVTPASTAYTRNRIFTIP
jgi:hypothetical protein